jgi:hypothetical protein
MPAEKSEVDVCVSVYVCVYKIIFYMLEHITIIFRGFLETVWKDFGIKNICKQHLQSRIMS